MKRLLYLILRKDIIKKLSIEYNNDVVSNIVNSLMDNPHNANNYNYLLRKYIELEDYERAALIRDKINNKL